MKILYDNVTSEYLYPLSKSDISKLKDVIEIEVINKIKSIRFGCNTKTTQEGRTVEHGAFYDIRINFCLNEMRSLILADEKSYIAQVKKFGGRIDFNTRFIKWTLSDAKCYSFFLLFHEIAHIVFALNNANTQFSKCSSIAEEKWCNDYAFKKIEQLKALSMQN